MNKFFWDLLKKILKQVSPEMREFIIDAIRGLYQKAKGTDTPVDDILVIVLAWLLRVELPDDD